MAGLRVAEAGARQVGFEDGRRGVSRSVGHRPGVQHQGSAATRKSRAVAAPRSARFPREQLSVQDSSCKTAGNRPPKVSMLRGSVLTRSLRGKVLDLKPSHLIPTPNKRPYQCRCDSMTVCQSLNRFVSTRARAKYRCSSLMDLLKMGRLFRCSLRRMRSHRRTSFS